MKIEFDTRYLEIAGGDIKTAMMLAVGITKQIEADKTDEPCEYGNYWAMTVNQWEALGFGGKKSQMRMRNILKSTDYWIDRGWGYPKHSEYLVKLEIIEELITQMKEVEQKKAERLSIIKKQKQEERLKELIGDG